MTEDKMIGWQHQFDGHEFEQVPGLGDGQGSPACCSPWGGKELDTNERLNNDDNLSFWHFPGGSVLKNSPANAGDSGLIPG